MQKLKDTAINLFNQGQFEETFQILWDLGCDEFMTYVLNIQRKSNRPLWLQHESGGKFFWEKFFVREDVFSTLLESDYGEDFLTIYLTKYDFPDKELLLKIAGSYPDLLIRAIRSNRTFLNPIWHERLSVLTVIPEFKAHALIWEDIRTIETNLWNYVQAQLPALVDYNAFQMLAEVTVWLEIERFGNHDNHTRQLLGRVYSFFVEKIFPDLPAFEKREIDLTREEPFFKVFMEAFATIYKLPECTSPLTKLMDAVQQWLFFYEKVCEPYFYDHNLKPIVENDLRLLQSSSRYHYTSCIDGIRYEVIRFIYQMQGAELVQLMEAKGELEIPKGRFPGDEIINRNIAGLKYGTLSLLLDLGINDFYYNDKSFSLSDILGPLITYSVNRNIRYEQSLEKHSKNAKNWFEAHMQMTMESFKQDVFKPSYLFLSEKEFQKLNQNAVGTAPDTSEAIINLFGYIPQSKESGRFDWKYDVWDRPLLRIGDFIFCPIMFWGANAWFYSFIQRALLIRGQERSYSKEIPDLEKYLGSLFEKRKWKVKVVSSEEAHKVNGDVDLIVEDGELSLLIQLKRTYLRLNIKDSYAESKMIDKKAADQLSKAEVFFRNENPVYNLKQNLVKWIVSTSFEGVHNQIKNCRKINYFELVIALKNQPDQPLKEFIAHLEKDGHLRAICDAVIQNNDEETSEILRSLGLPLTSFEPKAYKLPIASGNHEATEKYNRLFNDGLEYDAKGEKNKAIEHFHKCTLICDSDAEAWSALANCLGDTKQYDQAFLCFEKALQILPDDPFITRNYAFALLENKKHFEGIMKLIELCEKYPLLGNLRAEIAKALMNGMMTRSLTPAELQELHKRLPK